VRRPSSLPLPPSAFRPRSGATAGLSSSACSGLTLIELLVVIIILTTLVAAAIPLLTPTNEERRLREASRGLNAFISGAQAKAIQFQRPFGIALKKLSQDTGRSEAVTVVSDENDPGYTNDNGVCLEVFYAEQPPAFMGFDESSAAMLALYTPTDSSLYGGLRPLVVIKFVTRDDAHDPDDDLLFVGWDADMLPGVRTSDSASGSLSDDAGGVIRPGDVIEINGTRYQLLSDTDDSDVPPHFDATGTFFASNTGKNDVNNDAIPARIAARPLDDSGQLISVEFDDLGRPLRDMAAIVASDGKAANKPFWSLPAPYRILRQPTRTSDPPYQLPDGTAIDLRASGVGSDDYFYVAGLHDNPGDVLVMFSPEGTVSRVRFSREPYNLVPFDDRVGDNLFLLVGRRESIPTKAPLVDPTLSTSQQPTGMGGLTTDQQMQEVKAPVNWLRSDSRWVVIGSQSGRVVTADNAFVDPRAVLDEYKASPYEYSESTEEMRTGQIRDARQLVRDMTQLGGR
jgi:prepilin-type N-terminal cleavage/methylation domain-containing protein